MTVSSITKLFLSIPSTFILMMIVGASANFSRQWRSVVRFTPRRQIHAKSMTNNRYQHCWGNNNSAFVPCSTRRTKIQSTKFSHHNRLQPTASTQKSKVLHTSTVVLARYSHSILTDELNDSQKEATLRPRYSITRVVAGPGAGKTKVLTCRIAHLLLDNNDACGDHDDDDGYRNSNREGILAVTFTKKAAMEMETRLTDLLSTVVSESQSSDDMVMAPAGISTGDEAMLQDGEFVQYGNADPTDENNVDDAYARSLLRQATVGTFHSVCSKILRKFGRELGELPSVRQCVGVRSLSGAQITQEGVQAQSSDEDGQSMLSSALTLDGSFNILDQSDQLRLLKDVLKEHNIQLSSPAATSRGQGNDIRPITVLNAISLLNTEEALSSTQRGPKNEEESDKMSRKVRQIATQIRIPFQRAKYSQNSVDFDDLILLTRELLLQHPEVREMLHRRWRHVLVDEFQDTSQVQLELVRLLTTNSLFVVGDGDQSIYSWRGASPESMTSDFELAFHERSHGWEGLIKQEISLKQYLDRICRSSATAELPENARLEVQSVYLMENYRSTTNIVRAAQKIISASESNNGESTQETMRRDMKPMRGDGPSPRVLACKDGKSEAKFVVTTINAMVENGDLTPSSTVAMIYRTNAQSRLLEEACVEHNLRYVVRGSSGTFYKRAEIQDCMSFLKIMYNARDRSAWARAVKAPSRGIGEASLQEFFSYCDAVTSAYLEAQGSDKSPPTPLDVLMSFVPRGDGAISEMSELVPPSSCMSTRSMNRFIPFASSMKSLKDKALEQHVSEFLMSLIEDLNLRSHFDSISKTREEYEDRVGNVMELVRAANRYDDRGPCLVISEEELESPLGNFLDDVALIADIAPDDEADDGNGRIVANLMTIHSSKGMEFDAVFLVGNEEGTFPTQKAISEGKGSVELSEERRLCYVAMTRAKTHLVLTWRREVSYFAGSAFKTKDADKSRFLRILVSKRDGGNKPKATSSTGLGQSSQTQMMKKKQKSLNALTKRELHSEANRYLSSNPATGLRPKPRQVRGQSPSKVTHSVKEQASQSEVDKYIAVDPVTGLRPRQRQVGSQPSPGKDLNSVTKRGIHGETHQSIAIDPITGLRPVQGQMSRQPSLGKDIQPVTKRETDGAATNYLAPNARAAPKKSWDDWEPSTQKKSIKEIPKIRPMVPNGAQIQANTKPSPPNFASPQTTRQSFQQQQKSNGQRGMVTPPRSRESEISSNRMRNNNSAPSLRPQRGNHNFVGELPPDLDSTMFFPVGCTVKHKFHGIGIVQNPPPSKEKDYAEFAEKMLVRVKFSDGDGEWDVPMESVAHTFDS